MSIKRDIINLAAKQIAASLVWDNGSPDKLYVPESMGKAREDQLQGSTYEQIGEIAGRICYDSLGRGRPSFDKDGKEGFHSHVQNVKHLSVYEHAPVTFEIDCQDSPFEVVAELYNVCANRSGIFLRGNIFTRRIHLTANLRALLEWNQVSQEILPPLARSAAKFIGEILRYKARTVFPKILKGLEIDCALTQRIMIVPPKHGHEKWILCYVRGSRGMSHELVRHGDHTSISQRSTRYVDESEGRYVTHPLIKQYSKENPESLIHSYEVSEGYDKAAYRDLVSKLESFLKAKKVDATSARKQARGAARNYLGNGLSTELIFGASVLQWKRMLKQRGSAAADAEIRELFVDNILPSLKQSSFAAEFAEFVPVVSPDGIGNILKD